MAVGILVSMGSRWRAASRVDGESCLLVRALHSEKCTVIRLNIFREQSAFLRCKNDACADGEATFDVERVTQSESPRRFCRR